MSLKHKSVIKCDSKIKCACTLCEHNLFAGFFPTEACNQKLEEIESLPLTEVASTCICGISTVFKMSKDKDGIKIDEKN